MADKSKLYDNERSPKKASDEPPKKGDVDEYGWESYGSAGTRKGGDRFKDEDDEGDLDVEAYRKAQKEGHESLGRDYPNPNDAKGWRRHFFIKQVKPMS